MNSAVETRVNVKVAEALSKVPVVEGDDKVADWVDESRPSADGSVSS